MKSYPLILEPESVSEFEMQADLYFLLKSKGYKVRGEVRSDCSRGRVHFDLVVFRGSHGACIIEVKNSPNKAAMFGKKTLQNKKYGEFGVPIIYYTTAVQIEEVVTKVRALFE